MPALHHSLGTDGLLLRTERGVQALALANSGPLLDGAYATSAELQAAETGRVVAEVALDTPGALCLALRDSAGLLARVAGDQNPQYTLYRIAAVPDSGSEPQITYGSSERLYSLAEPCTYAALWSTAEPTLASTLDEPADTPAAWILTEPALVGSAADPLDSATTWTVNGTTTTGTGDLNQTTGSSVSTGANLTYLADTTADWATATSGGWKSALRWWANSSGPYTQSTAPSITAWHTLFPGAIWQQLTGDLLTSPTYSRSAGNGKGAISTPASGSAYASILSTGATVAWDPRLAWSIFIVAAAHSPLPAAQTVLFEAGPIGAPAYGMPLLSLAIHSGTSTTGMRICQGDQASRTFATAIGTGSLQIIEAYAAAGAAVSAFALAINGTAQAQASVTSGSLVPAWVWPPDQFGLFCGRTAPHFKGSCAEVILLQSADSSVRTAVRSYLATKFAITTA